MKNLIEALIKAQGEFPAVTKDAKNPHFGNAYATLDQVISITGPALRKNGLCIIQTFNNDLSLTTTLWHVSGEEIHGTQPLLMGKQDAQGLAGSSTYARRYGILSILGIASEDDDGQSAVKKPEPLSEEKINGMVNFLETAEDGEDLKKFFKDAQKLAKDDEKAMAVFIKSKDKRKKELGIV